MRVLLSTFGSRGDVEPIVALAAALMARGAQVRVCAPPDEGTIALMDRIGGELAPGFTSVRAFLEQVANGPPMDLPTRAAGVLAAQYEDLRSAAAGCDAVVAAGLFPSAAAARCVAEEKNIPYAFATFCPLFYPSAQHPPHAYPGHPLPPEITDNLALWAWDVGVKNAIFGGAVNALRERIGLPMVDNVRDHVFTGRPLLAADEVLGPWRGPGPLEVVQTGAWILPDERPLPDDLTAFIEAGAAPVYVGFGSMPMVGTKEAATRAAIEAARTHGRRVVLSHGWAELAATDDQGDVFTIGEVNQQALFPRMAAVVHHGGAGTTTTATRAGAPQVIVPQIVDQPYWASRVAALGVGFAHDGPTPTTESLRVGLAVALADETRARAREVAGTIRADGADVAAGILLSNLPAK